MANTKIRGHRPYAEIYDRLARVDKAYRTWYYQLSILLNLLLRTPIVRPRGFWTGNRSDGVEPNTIYYRATRLFAHEYGHTEGRKHLPWWTFDVMAHHPFRFRDRYGLLDRATNGE